MFVDIESLQKNAKLKINRNLDSSGQLYLPIFANWDPRTCNIALVIQDFIRIAMKEDLLQTVPIQSPIRSPTNNFHNEFTSPTNSEINQVVNNESINFRPPLPPKPATALEPEIKNLIISRADSSPDTIVTKKLPIHSKFQVTSNLPLPPKKIPLVDRASSITSPPPFQATSNISTQTPIGNKNSPTVSKPPLHLKDDLDSVQVDLLDAGFKLQQDPNHKNAIKEVQGLLNQLTTNDKIYINNNILNRKASIDSAIKQFENLYQYETKNTINLHNSIQEMIKNLKSETESVDKQFAKLNVFQNTSEPSLEEEYDPLWMTTTETIGLNQLYTLVAKDKALSDTINMLYQMLNRGIIQLDIFVKKSRELGRQQFLTRLHIEKIAGLLLRI
ncbi:ubiquitin-binding ESCRT-I subunit protein STP22 NDAI_0G04160 [Naumovozyma dairenensis CBS 421]|uniref:SB domain-containing protein n=1 Tax=Naumovozyma dairenensis (strain ATCC 10597 / BCRC 20456 / CBS 421 / NBRC 0211 / NRRL Y-12639) TaxID=1071378 RepID=J7S4E0_NAUDC|nr:hypothetical protein NDAI_0G04160 [Naumovozyma dairenensis CBS 421]CCK73401.1 hypothetical protein NDAI_0G04160 [Naumovozyma dairenensis CBS 421]